jgi:hypothetical protein
MLLIDEEVFRIASSAKKTVLVGLHMSDCRDCVCVAFLWNDKIGDFYLAATVVTALVWHHTLVIA